MKILLISFCVIVVCGVTNNSYLSASADQHLVNVAVAGIYEKPDLSSPYDSQKIYGSPVTLIKHARDGWVKIRTTEGIEGYCLKNDLIADTKDWLSTPDMQRVKSLIGCVYPKPLVQSQTIIRLSYGSPIVVIDTQEKEDWVKVQLANGTVGWMVCTDIEKPVDLSLDEAIERARMFLGIPYIWGGTSAYGIDCSGLSQCIAIQRGYTGMARNASQQCRDKNLIVVPLHEVQPGDFIYFEKNGRIIHVALCSAPGMMIHAYCARGISKVVETPIEFLADIIKEARRLPV